MSHPSAESLVVHALGPGDPAVGDHVAACTVCEAEIDRLKEAATILRGRGVFEHRADTPECLDEVVIADFIEGRLGPDTRAPVVAHLLTCARCRSLVVSTGRLLADAAVATEAGRVPGRPWRHWAVLAAAAAAALVLVIWPRSTNDAGSPILREPGVQDTIGPVPIAPRAAVTGFDRFVWSRVPRAQMYRLRLYDDEGTVLWTHETSDTAVARPDSIALQLGVSYLWKVEAQTGWQRWVASDLAQFQLTGSSR